MYRAKYGEENETAKFVTAKKKTNLAKFEWGERRRNCQKENPS
jgi:hypothetical protein